MFDHTYAQNICLQQCSLEVRRVLPFCNSNYLFTLSLLGHIFLLGFTFHFLQ